MDLTHQQTTAVIDLLHEVAEVCHDITGTHDPDDLPPLTGTVDLVRWEITGLADRLAEASRRINGTPRATPVKPGPKPPPQQPKQPKKEGK